MTLRRILLSAAAAACLAVPATALADPPSDQGQSPAGQDRQHQQDQGAQPDTGQPKGGKGAQGGAQPGGQNAQGGAQPSGQGAQGGAQHGGQVETRGGPGGPGPAAGANASQGAQPDTGQPKGGKGGKSARGGAQTGDQNAQGGAQPSGQGAQGGAQHGGQVETRGGPGGPGPAAGANASQGAVPQVGGAPAHRTARTVRTPQPQLGRSQGGQTQPPVRPTPKAPTFQAGQPNVQVQAHGRQAAKPPANIARLGDWNPTVRGADRDQAGQQWRQGHQGWDQRAPWRGNTNWWRGHSGFRLYVGARLGFFFIPELGYIAVPHQYEQHYWRAGDTLPSWFWRYKVRDYWNYGLPQPPDGCAWVWVDNDVALVEMSDGYIVDIVHNAW
ncbi:MAG: RcnB family protein [Caulobacterales bacterium]